VSCFQRFLSDNWYIHADRFPGYPLRYAGAWSLLSQLSHFTDRVSLLDIPALVAAAKHDDGSLAGPCLIIFLRKDGRLPPVRVACVTDRDVPPEEARAYVKVKSPERRVGSDYAAADLGEIVTGLQKSDGGVVKTFVSPGWTLEHDLALYGLAKEVHAAVAIAKELKSKDGAFDDAQKTAAIAAAAVAFDQNLAGLTSSARAAAIYQPVFKREASKPEIAQVLADILQTGNFEPAAFRAMLPPYLVEAIDYVTGTGAAPAP
jgi:putative ATP-dependent endonuclease of OLD family